MTKSIRKKKNTGIRLVKKANKLVESRYKFDIWETRVFLSVLSQINREDEDLKVYRIWYKDLIKSFGLKSSQSYGFLRDAAKGLMRKVFYVTNIENGQKRETEYHIIRTVNYLSEGEKGGDNQEFIDITIDTEMKPLLLQLGNNYKGIKGEGFTAYDLRNITKLGAYHIRIYELLKQYQRIGKRTLRVEEIKRMLEIKNEYPRFANLNQKVIIPSIDAINKYTDLKVYTVEKIKEGRKIAALYFEFREKTKEEKQQARGEGVQKKLLFPVEEAEVVEQESSKQDMLFDEFSKQLQESFGVTPSMFLKTLNDNPNITKERIEKAMRVTRRMRTNGEIIKSVGGYFITALKKEYTDPKEERNKKSKARQKRELELKEKLLRLEKLRDDKINNKIRELVGEDESITTQAINAIKENPMNKKYILLKEQKLGRKLEVEDYREDKRLRTLVTGKIVALKKDNFTDILTRFETDSKKLKNQ